MGVHGVCCIEKPSLTLKPHNTNTTKQALRAALLGPSPDAAQASTRDRNRVYPAHVVPPPPSLIDAPPRWLDTRPKPLLTRLSDFHLLVYLARCVFGLLFVVCWMMGAALCLRVVDASDIF